MMTAAKVPAGAIAEVAAGRGLHQNEINCQDTDQAPMDRRWSRTF